MRALNWSPQNTEVRTSPIVNTKYTDLCRRKTHLESGWVLCGGVGGVWGGGVRGGVGAGGGGRVGGVAAAEGVTVAHVGTAATI